MPAMPCAPPSPPLVGVPRGFAGQADRWRFLFPQGVRDSPRFPVTDQAIANRLADAGAPPGAPAARARAGAGR